jgi:Phosphotransferase enzyme family
LEPLEHGPPAQTGGLWRVHSGAASAVLKLVQLNPAGHPRWPAAAEQEHPYYWRREPLAYESGLLERLGELRAPRLLASVTRSDDAVALWLEDESRPPAFTPVLLGTVAERLGAAQGRLALELPAAPWLSRRWLRAYLVLRGPLSREQERTLARVEAAPQTLCHLDFYPGNLLGPDGSVVIDWAYCGIGALGEDPGNLVPDAMFDGFVPVSQARELEEAVWEGYLAGLTRSPWRGDEQEVRWVFRAATVLKYTWMPAAIDALESDDPLRARWEGVMPLLRRWADEAARLRL